MNSNKQITNPKLVLCDYQTLVIPDYTKSTTSDSRIEEIMNLRSEIETNLILMNESTPMKNGKTLFERFSIDFLINCALKASSVTKSEAKESEKVNQIKTYYCMAVYSKRRYDDENVFSALKNSSIELYSKLKEEDSKKYVLEIVPKEFLEYVKK